MEEVGEADEVTRSVLEPRALRTREYELVERDPQWGDAHDVEGGELIAVSDGSLRHGRAAFAIVPV